MQELEVDENESTQKGLIISSAAGHGQYKKSKLTGESQDLKSLPQLPGKQVSIPRSGIH